MSIGRVMTWSAGVAALLACGMEGSARDADADTARTGAAVQDTQTRPGTAASARPTIVFMGTSLTAGLGVSTEDAFPALIATRLDSAGLPYDVVNAGSSGETSAGALQRIPWLLANRAFDVLVLETGANDGLRGLDVAGTRSNIDSILAAVRAARPDAQLFLVQMEAPPNLGEDYTRRFRGMFPELAARHGATLVPFLLEGVAGVDSLNQGDGIHPNEAGHRRLAATVWAAMEGRLDPSKANR